MAKLFNNMQLGFDDVRIVQQESPFLSRNDAILEREFTYSTYKTNPIIPIIAANMATGSFQMAKTLAKHNMMTALHKYHSLETLLEFWTNNINIAQNNTFYTMGISNEDLKKYNEFCTILKYSPKYVCLDIAHGGMTVFTDFITEFRKNNPFAIIMAGNISTAKLAKNIIKAGANICKVGIANGAQCLTNRVTGCGRPQFSTIIDTIKAKNFNELNCPSRWDEIKFKWKNKRSPKQYNGYIASDGGCSEYGHIGIAFLAGADFVMLGSLLSGTDECEGELIEKDGKLYKEFFGMSSKTAMNKFGNGISNYKTSEGRTTLSPYKGSVESILNEIKGALNSTLSYNGTLRLEEAHKTAKFIRVNSTVNRSYEKHTIGN